MLLAILTGVALTPGYVTSDTLESDLLDQLQQDMAHFSELATETRQNVDYMPYVISTLAHQDLLDLGVQNLREALVLVPGVDLTVGMAGVRNPIFRGSNPYAFGQSRLIIDGMVVNDHIFGGYNQLLEMPVDIIHRIEVVRGPGSMQQHVNGYAGSIHVITKAGRDDGEKVSDEIFAVAGSDQHAGAGLIKQLDLGNGTLTADVYFQKNDQKLPVDQDRFGNSGEADQGIENYQIGANYQQGGFSARLRLSSNDSGVSYGQAFSLSEDPDDFLDVANNVIELRYVHSLNNRYSLEFALNYFDETRELQNKVMPDGAINMMTMMPLPNGRYFLVDYSEQNISERIQLNINLDVHRIAIGFEATQSSIDKNNAAISNNDLLTSMPIQLFSNDGRDINTFYIEDLYDLTEKTSFQAGAKFTNYSDEDSESAYRLAMVHRFDDVNIFKAMFSQAFREPSYREQYLTASSFFLPNSNLESEQVDAFELAYIHRLSHRDYFKTNIFLLKNENQIDAQNATRTFTNADENKLKGIEFEYEKNLFNRDVVGLNISFIDGDNVTDALANSAETLARAYYLYRYSDDLNFSLLYKYTGDKGRTTLDSRDDVDAYQLLDLTASYYGLAKDVRLSLSIKNILDEEYYYPSPNNTYAGDFRQAERSWILRLSKEF